METGTGNVCHVVRTYVPFQRYRIYSLQAATFGSPRESSRLARETADEPSYFVAFSSSRPRLERPRSFWMTNSFGQWPSRESKSVDLQPCEMLPRSDVFTHDRVHGTSDPEHWFLDCETCIEM